jgi:Family of unknown function (DUF6529)
MTGTEDPAGSPASGSAAAGAAGAGSAGGAPAARATAAVILPLAAGAAVAVALGGYGRVHQARRVEVDLAGFSSVTTAKVWLATVVLLLALAQVGTALALYRRLPGTDRRWVAPVHRWSGRLAFLLMLPIAAHCLYVLGAAGYDPRTLLHSLAGCVVFGAFTTKMLALPQARARWLVPLAGGLLFTALVGVWLTSALWFFTTFGARW